MATTFLNRPHGRIAYDVTGNGPLVVCVPSMGDMRAEYRFLIPQLTAAGFQVATMDVRGHGESSVGWPDYSAAAIGSDIVTLIHELDAGPAVLVGTSMAAAASVWAAAETPDLVAGMILIGPFVRDVPVNPVMKLMLKGLVAGSWGPAFWSTYYAKLYPTAPPADFASYRRALKANLREPGRFAALKQMLWASKADCEARIPDVAAPALVIMGSKDPDFKDPSAEAELVATRLNGQRLMIDGAGHYPHAEMPEQAGRAIIEFLEVRFPEVHHAA